MSDTLEILLLELKAKIESIEVVRRRLKDLNAQCVGIFQQIDTYFNSPKGRLKLREFKGEEKATLIYYERENVIEPKKSNVLILEINESESFRMFFEQVFGKKVVVKKTREIYMYQGTQIHLDIVKGLGTFIEFERKIEDFNEDQKILGQLRINLKIKEKNLLKGSYSDMF